MNHNQSNSSQNQRRSQPHRGSSILLIGICGLFGIIVSYFLINSSGTSGIYSQAGSIRHMLGSLVFIVSLVLSILAWIFGHKDIKRMRNGKMDPSGMSSTKTGKVLGIIGVCLIAIMVIIGAIMASLIFGIQDYQSNKASIAQEANTYASMAMQFYKTPKAQNGAGNDFSYVTDENLANWFKWESGVYKSETGTFRIEGNGPEVVITAIGNVKKDNEFPKVVTTVSLIDGSVTSKDEN
jgi:uncharacterized membrane protein YidH (DUF202 family)